MYANGMGAKTIRPWAGPSGPGGLNNIRRSSVEGDDGGGSATSCALTDLDDDAMKDMKFKHPALVYARWDHHGGDDVGLWAKGPMAYLFHKNHEQSYVAHVVGMNQ